jgi:hypothetical protein
MKTWPSNCSWVSYASGHTRVSSIRQMHLKGRHCPVFPRCGGISLCPGKIIPHAGQETSFDVWFHF